MTSLELQRSSGSQPGTWRVRDGLLLALLALLILLPGTWVSLFDRDEGWYAQVSREMIASGDWVTPTYLAQPWLHKPPGLYWLVSASFQLLGRSEFAGRLVSVLAMVVSVALVGWLASQLYGRRAGWIAGVSFITAGLPIVIGRMLITDALLLACILSAVVALWRLETLGIGPARVMAFWIAFGLGILVKGPAIGLFIVGFAIAVIVTPGVVGELPAKVTEHPTRWYRSLRFWAGALVGLPLGLSWYVLVATRAGAQLVSQFVWYESLSRLVSAPHGHTGPPGYYLLIGLAGWLPWTVLVPGAFLTAWAVRKSDARARRLVLWCGLPWLLLELIPSKLPHYVLPCFVPLAILLGRMWETGLSRVVPAHERRVMTAWAVFPVLLGLALLAIVVLVQSELLGRTPLAALGLILVLGFGVVVTTIARERYLASFVVAAGTSVVFHLVAGAFWLPALEPGRLSRNIATAANAMSESASSPLLVCGYEEPSMFFYLNRDAVVTEPAEIATILADRPRRETLLIVGSPVLQSLKVDPERLTNFDKRSIDGLNYVNGKTMRVWILRDKHADDEPSASVKQAGQGL